MKSDFEVEITCPCCDAWCEVSYGKLEEYRKQQRCKDNQIICGNCWGIFRQVMKRFRKEHHHDTTN